MLWATICVWREASPFVAGKIIMENGAKRHNEHYQSHINTNFENEHRFLQLSTKSCIG
jgi:hypothetical protein